MINFWHKHLLDSNGDQGAAVMRLPAAAKIQLGERDVYPWAKECGDQVQEMGHAALAHHGRYLEKARKVTNERILESLNELRELVVHNVAPIPFQARRMRSYRHLNINISTTHGTYVNGGDMD